MKDLLALTIPGNNNSTVAIQAPEGIPSGISLGNILGLSINVALVFGVLLSLVYFAYGGLFYIQSKGDKEKLDKSRRILLYSIFGLVVMSLSMVIVNLVASAFGVKTIVLPNP